MKKIRNILFLLGIIVLLSSCTNSNKKYRGEEDNTDYKIEIPEELYGKEQKEYKVNHYFENNDGEYISQYKDTLVGNIGDKTDAKAKEIEGFRANAFEQKDINNDSDISVDIYYDLLSYTVSLTSNSENAGIAGSGTYNRYNNTAYLEAVPNIGYRFIGWYLENTCISPDKEYSFKVTDDLDILAKFEKKEEFIPFKFESNFEECIITGLDDKSIKDLVIPEGVTEINQYAFQNDANIEKVTFPQTLTRIGNRAFDLCTNLFTIIFKSQVTIASGCFDNCFNTLEIYDLGNNNITLPNSSVNAYGKLASYAKVVHTSISDESIYDVDQNGFVFATLDNTKYLVGYKENESEVVLPTKNDNYKVHEYAFYNKDLSVLTIPSCVTEIGDYAFASGDGTKSRTYGIDHLYEIYNLSSLTLSIGNTTHGYVAKNAKEIHTSLDEDKCIFTIDDFIYKKETISNINYARIIAYLGNTTITTIQIPTIGDLKIIIDKNLFSVDLNSNFRNLNEVILSDNVVSIEEKVFKNCNNLKNINLENVESIGTDAFNGCKALEEIDLTSCTTIGIAAFSNCSLLKKANLLECETIGNSAFNNCYLLEEVTFPKIKTLDSFAFNNCYSLLQITLPSTINTINSQAFYQCYRLVEVINNSGMVITVNSTNNGYVGKYAKNIITSESYSKLRQNNNLKTYEDGTNVILMDVIECGDELVIPTNITGIAQLAFYGLKHITSLSIPVLDNVLAYYFGVANYYGSYASADLPNKLIKIYLTGNIETIPEKAFYGRNSIKEINIPAAVTSIEAKAFEGVSLNNLYYDGYINNWTNIQFGDSDSNPMMRSNNSYLRDDNGDITYGNMRYNSITSVSLTDDITSIGAYQFAGLPFESFTIPSTVTSIGVGAFSGCKNLKIINIPTGVTEIPTSSFYGCIKLSSIENLDSITSIGEYAFAECASLIKISIPNVEIKTGLFQNCINLQKVNLDDDIEIIGDNAFNGCKSLSNLTLPSKLTTVGSQAFANSKIREFVAPISLSTIGAKAFYNCSNLVEIDLRNTSITSVSEENNLSIISGCKKLSIVTLPDTFNSFTSAFVDDLPKVSYSNGLYFGTVSNPYYYFYRPVFDSVTEFSEFHSSCCSIYKYAFYNCTSLESVIIPDSVKKIDDYAFGYCINLDYLEIGSGLEEVLGDYSFYYCTSLNTIFFNGDVSDFELIKPTYGDWYEYSGLETIICNDADLSLS